MEILKRVQTGVILVRSSTRILTGPLSNMSLEDDPKLLDMSSTAVSDVCETSRRGNRLESGSFAASVSQVRRPATADERG